MTKKGVVQEQWMSQNKGKAKSCFHSIVVEYKSYEYMSKSVKIKAI